MWTPPPPDRTSRTVLTAEILGFLAAVIGLLTAVVTLGPDTADDTPSSSTAPAISSSVPPASPTTAPSTGSSDPARTSAPPSRSPTKAEDNSAHTIRNSALGFTIYTGAEVDLDVLPSGASGDGLAELVEEGATMNINRLSQYAVLGTAVQANYENCRDAARYVPGDQATGQLIEEGTYFCIKTSGHRYAALRLISVSPLAWTFNIETYDPPLD